MYLIDTNVVSEARKQEKANPGVGRFFERIAATGDPVYLTAITIGELRRGVDLIRHRGDREQATLLGAWLATILDEYADSILPFDTDAALIWARLRVPNADHELDKQIAAIALVNDLTVVTRNTAAFAATGVRVLNPFASGSGPGGSP